ncbi:barstar family protein [Kurthia huakuii]|uniref:barstar family protein n=1 Tax=Kurthia huakuii TaxID=1421019 RepID=UPI0038993C0F
MFREFAEKFSFPNYFGKNWAAFNECLNDLEWLEADEYVLIITNFEHLLAKKPNERDIFLEILKSTMYQWTFQMDTSFQVIVRHKK